jgi:hypothetical protein
MKTEVTRMPAQQTHVTHVTEWVLGFAGALAAGIGAWMYFVPTDWFLGGLAEGWYFGMFIAAGLFLAAAFGLLARKYYVKDTAWTTRVVVPTLLSIVGLAAAIGFAMVLIL